MAPGSLPPVGDQLPTLTSQEGHLSPLPQAPGDQAGRNSLLPPRVHLPHWVPLDPVHSPRAHSGEGFPHSHPQACMPTTLRHCLDTGARSSSPACALRHNTHPARPAPHIHQAHQAQHAQHQAQRSVLWFASLAGRTRGQGGMITGARQPGGQELGPSPGDVHALWRQVAGLGSGCSSPIVQMTKPRLREAE